MPATRVCFVSASGQNVFFAEILEALASALRVAGYTVEESTDCFPAPADDLVYLYVPHEFHPMVEELAHPTRAQLGRTVVLCTEQPGNQWFQLSCEVAARAGSVLDINLLGVRELKRWGIAARHVPLGYVPAWDLWQGEEQGERSIDLAFLGGYAERRAAVLARCASLISGRRCAIQLTESAQPHTAASRSFLAGQRKWKLLAETKVLLNVHRTALPYMEWHRVIGAVLNGCVVLSEHALGTEPLRPGKHFVSSNYETLPEVLEGLLADPWRMRKIRQDAYRLVCEEMPLERTLESLEAAVEQAAEKGLGPRRRRTPAGVPLPLPPPRRTPGWEADAQSAGEALPRRMALKHLVVKMRVLERQLEALAAGEAGGAEIIEQLGPARPNPRVSVLLTVHNYARQVGEALRSVALSDLRDLELVAVDDASTDDSVAAVRAASADSPWLSVKLLRLRRNRGLPAARNLALQHAQADLLFILDADNAVLPGGLSRLAAALEEHPDAAFAYGILEAFDNDRPVGVMNWLDWDPSRLRYGNFVDAMAMVRRSALERVGGYSTDPALYGWEDFDLWAAMASAGLHGVKVPEFVARYRQSQHSMISLANVDSLAAWATLLRRHPALADDDRQADAEVGK